MSAQNTTQRYKFCTFTLTVLLFLLMFRLYIIQVAGHTRFLKMALEQQEDIVSLEPERGNIYDRNGHPLTMNIQACSLFANPREIEDKFKTAKLLSTTLGLEYNRILNELGKRKRSFVWIKRKLDQSEVKKITALNLKGIYFLNELRRFYPKGDCASHLLGFVGVDNEGLEGIEKTYNSLLRGTPVKAIIQKDGTGRNVFFRTRDSSLPQKGSDLTLTIDEVIQHFAQMELKRAYLKYRAKSATIIVMNPCTGEILALANEPGFDPNHFMDYTPEVWRNHAITDVFEPGSTFKIITAGAALEEGVVDTDDRLDCENGMFRFEDRIIRDVHKYKILTFSQVIEHSSNIGITKVGMKIGKYRLYQYIRAFGFGDVTGVGLCGECKGIVRAPENWSKVSIAAIPYGQEIAVTPLQIITAVSAVANGGTLLKPQIIMSRPFQPVPVRRVLSKATCSKLTEVLEKVVESGTGVEARIPGYRIAGKTGTAQKINPSTGRYDPSNFVSSFVGYFPARDPKIIIYVQVDEPKGEQFGGMVAAPVFKSVAQKIINYLGIMPDSKPLADDLLNSDGSERRRESGGGAVLSSVEKDSCCRIMPDLRGKSLRRVMEIMGEYPVKLQIYGSGIAVSQSPACGTTLREGQKVSVTFRHYREEKMDLTKKKEDIQK